VYAQVGAIQVDWWMQQHVPESIYLAALIHFWSSAAADAASMTAITLVMRRERTVQFVKRLNGSRKRGW